MTINEVRINAETRIEWTEPQLSGVTTINFDPSKYMIDEALQNRVSGNTAGTKLTQTPDGFVVTQAKAEAISEYFIAQAKAGVSSAVAVDPITVAVLDDKEYFVGGHGRAAGLMLARQALSEDDGMAKSLLTYGMSAKEVSESKEDYTELADSLKQLRVRKYRVQNRRDIEWLAAMENSDAQNGQRLSKAEQKALIVKHLSDPAFAQFKDLAFAVRVLGNPSARGTVYNTRKAMWKDGSTPYEKGELDVNGKPNGAVGAGTNFVKTLNTLGQRLEDNFNSLSKIPLKERDAKTYTEFEKMRNAWDAARKSASRWIQYRMDDGRTQEEHLLDDLSSLEARIGYTEYQASVANSQEGETKTTTDAQASEEATELAERIKRENAENIPQNVPPNDEPDVVDVDDASAPASAPASVDADADTDAPSTASATPPKEVPFIQKVSEAAFMAEALIKKLDDLNIDVGDHAVKIADILNDKMVELDTAEQAEASEAEA